MVEYPTKSWLSILFRLRGTVLPRVAVRTALCMGIAAVVAYARLERGMQVGIPIVMHTVVGVALGLLLVFRTTASYDRYWEGRRLLGGIVNRCRDVMRQAASYLPHEVAERSGQYTVALYATIRRYLRNEREWGELEETLDERELAAFADHRAPPLLVSRWMTELWAAAAADGQLSEQRLQLLDGNATAIIDLWGGAERIMKTPVPFAYAHHIKVFLSLFCFSIPLALVEPMGWNAVIGAGVVAVGLFGIDEIGVEIEDPFGYDPNDLPLDAIGQTIATDVGQITRVMT